MKDVLILGIETSCDDTSVAIVANGERILSNIVSSQVNLHKQYGGVVPEIASRKHLELINPLVAEALPQAEVELKDITAIAVTIGPGLVGALLIGLATAKALSYVTGLPLVGVNHLEGHIYANFLEHPDLKPPLVALVVSGGHTCLVYMQAYQKYEVLGATLDDAAGEAFDKIAKFLDLGYPGGPFIDELARQGDPKAIKFPRAMIHADTYDFSLSGLKTAVIYYVSRQKEEGRKISLPDLCASFQEAIIEVQISKILRAAAEKGTKTLVIAGGVAANTSLRQRLREETRKRGLRLFHPSPSLCTDNAAMIACSGYWKWEAGKYLALDTNVDPNLSLA